MVAPQARIGSPRALPDLDELAREVASRARLLAPGDREELETTLLWDVRSEFDARFLGAHARASGIEWSAEFRRALAGWEGDEEVHYLWFRHAYLAAFPEREPDLARDLATREEGVDFGPLEHLMQDELTLLCLLAYDELATVGAFRAARGRYALLGPKMSRLVERVIGDEGRHYASFLGVIRKEHVGRVAEAREAVRRVLAVEGLPYANTFVLDHDDAIWSEAIFERARRTLLRALR